jgi:O-acetyl-ADP-ribose deacetylase (regulator of RNase III)
MTTSITQQISFGDILSVDRGIIVHGCNAKGVMGSGVALAIRRKYPEAFRVYREIFEEDGLELGTVCFVDVGKDLVIANAITQENYNNQRNGPACMVDYAAIKSCFQEVANEAKYLGLPVHYPMIGAGLGGGDWNIIQEIIEETLYSVERTLWKLPPLPSF